MDASTTAPYPAIPMPLLDNWIDAWNGDYAGLHRIVGPDFRVHTALVEGGDGSGIRDADGLIEWVKQIRAALPDLRFTVEVGPLVDGEFVSARWIATGTYVGGFPGAQADLGTFVTWTGTDTLRMEQGQFVEYWLNADSLSLLTQLKAV